MSGIDETHMATAIVQAEDMLGNNLQGLADLLDLNIRQGHVETVRRLEQINEAWSALARVLPFARLALACSPAKTEAPATVHRFRVGRTYSTRSACDYECVYSFVILARTAKSVTVDVHGKTVRRGLQVYHGVEQFKPFGSYSMAAVISADKVAS